MEETKKRSVELDIQEELVIDETKLDEELLRQPSRFFYWATSWALAAKKSKQVKLAEQEVEARLGKQFREKMTADDQKIRVTEKMVNEYTVEHPEYKTARHEVINAEYLEDMLWIAKEAFRQRHQALVELYKTSLEQKYYETHGFDQMQKELEERRSKGKRGKNKEE